MTEKKRWLAFYLLCAGEFMIVIDTTIINVALPSIQADLRFSDASLVWVVNAYMVTYGGFLLLGGRLGDLYGQRRWFLLGTALFTAASLVCALANTQWLLVVARAVQGLGGAAVSAIALSLIMNLFSEAGERAKAMGIYGFICAGGGSVGVLAGRRAHQRARAGTGCSSSTCRSARWCARSASRCCRRTPRLRRNAGSTSPAPSP